jgi:hypothetical protein
MGAAWPMQWWWAQNHQERHPLSGAFSGFHQLNGHFIYEILVFECIWWGYIYIMINRMMLVVSLLCSTIIRMMMTMTDMFEVAWNHQSASKILRFGVLIFRGWAKQDQRWSEAMAARTHHNCRRNPYWCQCWLPVYIAHCQVPIPRLEKPAAVDRLKWQPCFPTISGRFQVTKGDM